MKKWIDASVWRFLLVGVGNTLLSLMLMFLLEGLGYWPSTAIAYVAGAVMSFFLNRSFTFHSDVRFWPSAVKFAVNVAVCYLGPGGHRHPPHLAGASGQAGGHGPVHRSQLLRAAVLRLPAAEVNRCIFITQQER